MEIAPRVLCLQLNRLEFEKGEAVKRKHFVSIEKTIKLDRFMLKNKELYK